MEDGSDAASTHSSSTTELSPAHQQVHQHSPTVKHSHISPHIGSIETSGKMDADLMDEKRKEHIAYEYLCHLEEAKKWIEACIEEELPPTTELEQALRNGVILCKLGHYYSPEVIPLRRIYDLDEAKYRAKGLHFKHTDNFNYWLRSLSKVGLPKIFYPITTDLYDRKNMPRVIYCIHALSLYLHKLGKAPEIQDLLGTATFTEEEISAMKKELDKYGINMPSFGKIGGILANEITVDEAAMHAAILAVNEALEKEDSSEVLTALQNPHTCLVKVDSGNIERYHTSLLRAKKDKAAKSQNGDVDDSDRDVYEYMLTQAEIQDDLNQVNTAVHKEVAEAKMKESVEAVNAAIASASPAELLHALQSEGARFSNVRPENLQWYMEILAKAVTDKAEMEDMAKLSHSEIQDMINLANQVAEHTRLVEAGVRSINDYLETGGGDPDKIFELLQNKAMDLNELYEQNKQYYHDGLLDKRHGKEGEHGLTEEEIQAIVIEMNDKASYDRKVDAAVSDINACIMSSDTSPEAIVAALSNEYAQIQSVDETCGARYHMALRQAREDKGEELTREEIVNIIEKVNEEVRLERLAAKAEENMNSALESNDPAFLLERLTNEHAGIVNIQEPQALHYLTLLKAMKNSKAEATRNPDIQLTREEIQSAIDKANSQTIDAIGLAQAVCAINDSLVVGGDPATTLNALKAPSVGIRSITDECVDTYHEKLTEARKNKAEKVGNEGNSGWSEYRTKEGHTYYHNFETGQSQWERPDNYKGTSPLLSKDEIQAVVTKVTADFDRWSLMKSNEPLIIQLQAHWRGLLVRRPFKERVTYLKDHEQNAVTLQANWKGYKQRKAYKERMEFLKQQTEVAVKIQAMARMWRSRKAYKERLQFFGEHVDDIVKIQSFWRAKKAKKDYTQLVQVSQPPASTVRKFLALLEQSDIDFSEELECQRLKTAVVQQIRSNQQLEQDLNVMDIKIGLLVKNRISLQDVVTHSQLVKRKDKKAHRHSQLLDGGAVAGAGVGGLTKANQQKLEAYQHLFYLLQTNPTYFAKLIFEMPQSRTNRFLENVVLTVFNYAQNNREQYLLVKLFETALREEINSKVDKIMDIVTGNPTVIKMVIHYTRGERGQNALRELLGPIVKEVIERKDMVLLTSPVDTYRAWINQMETQTGEASKLPYDVSNDQALEHEEVRKRVEATTKDLQQLADRFQQSILNNTDKIPYAMRYIAMQLRLLLHSKFPEAPEDDILKVVGNLLYYRYMNPAIVAPDAFDIIDVGVDQQLSPEQRRNLGSIAKILQHASACKLFEAENAALSPMNNYIQQAFGRFREFFLKASTVDPPETKLGIDEYSDVTMLTKPVIHISVKEICSTHSLLIDHSEAVAPDANDPIHEILRELGPSPSVESLLGGVRETAPGEDKQDVINEAGKQEIGLTLTSKVDSLTKDDGTNMKALFVRTKRMVVDVLRVQHGENLTQVLYTPATPEQEEEHQEWVKKKEQSDEKQIKRSKTIKRSDSLQGDRNLPLEGMKRKIMRNLRTLEEEGMVNSKNDYQDIINAIAKDIRNQHRYRIQRKQELSRLQETLDKLTGKAHFYEEQMEFYQQYVKSCLDQLAKAGGGKGQRSSRAVPGQDTSGFKKQSFKYTAQKLYEKGVILEIEGLPNHQFRNVVFEITSIDVGVFEVAGKFFGRQIEKVELVFQDLLQLQYEGLAIMKMFERAKINVNLLIYLINKKFYGRVQ